MPLYLVHFAHKWHAMRVPEIESVAQMLGVEVSFDAADVEPLSYNYVGVMGDPQRRFRTAEQERAHFWIRAPDDEVVRRMATRLILVESIIEVWAHGADWAEVHAALAANMDKVRQQLSAAETFRIRVDGFGKNYSEAEQVALMQAQLADLPWPPRARLDHPELDVRVFMDHRVSANLAKKAEHAASMAASLRTIYVGRRVAAAVGLKLAARFKLPKRRFLGPTTLDNELSMIIANMAHARPGTLVFDPFVGTASILVACAHFGACVVGADLDGRMIHGKGPGRTIGVNFEQYGLPQPLGLLRADFGADSACWRESELFDAIVCDPPYGVRASSKTVADDLHGLPEEERASRMLRRERLDINPLLEGLLTFAAARLRVGGRLVFLLPTTTDMRGSAAPEHPALRLIAESEQPINTKWCRRLVTFEKMRPMAPDDRVSFERREANLFDTAKLGLQKPTSERKAAAIKRGREARRQRALGQNVPSDSAPRKAGGSPAAEGLWAFGADTRLVRVSAAVLAIAASLALFVWHRHSTGSGSTSFSGVASKYSSASGSGDARLRQSAAAAPSVR